MGKRPQRHAQALPLDELGRAPSVRMNRMRPCRRRIKTVSAHLARCHLISSRSNVAVSNPSFRSGCTSMKSPSVFLPTCRRRRVVQQRVGARKPGMQGCAALRHGRLPGP